MFLYILSVRFSLMEGEKVLSVISLCIIFLSFVFLKDGFTLPLLCVHIKILILGQNDSKC